MRSKSDKDLLNTQRQKAYDLRLKIESLNKQDIDNGYHLCYAVEVTNILNELEKLISK